MNHSTIFKKQFENASHPFVNYKPTEKRNEWGQRFDCRVLLQNAWFHDIVPDH